MLQFTNETCLTQLCFERVLFQIKIKGIHKERSRHCSPHIILIKGPHYFKRIRQENTLLYFSFTLLTAINTPEKFPTIKNRDHNLNAHRAILLTTKNTGER